jgi:hypothetical protein
MARKVTTQVREKVTGVARRGATRVRSVAANALGAAAGAAAEVVLQSAVAGLKSGATDLEAARPRIKKKVHSRAVHTIGRRKTKSASRKKTPRMKKRRR